jgi:hypothetical protein
LWLIKVWFSASTFVVKIATFAKLQTVCDLKDNQFDYPCFKTDESRSLDDDFQE